jgi:hypothetical protein
VFLQKSQTAMPGSEEGNALLIRLLPQPIGFGQNDYGFYIKTLMYSFPLCINLWYLYQSMGISSRGDFQ